MSSRRVINSNISSNAAGGSRQSNQVTPAARGRATIVIGSSPEAEEMSVSAQRKRKYPDDTDNAPLPITTAMSALIDQLRPHGKHLARTVDLFGSWLAILHDGLEEQEMNRDPEDVFTPLERANQKKFKSLLATFTTIEGERFIDAALDEDRGQTFSRKAAAELVYQAGQAKQNDNATLKKLVIKWLRYPDGLDQDEKQHRGFKHDATARYLLPMSLYPFSTQKRMDIDDGKISLESSDWPLFLWPNNECPEDPRKRRHGLFRSEIMIKSAKAIFTSPSSANGSDRSRRQSNASKNNMTEVTPATIAYVASLVYYALSNDSAFNITTTAGFNLKTFYLGIIEYLELEENADRVDKLFAWWNTKLFPNARRGGGSTNGQRFPTFDVYDEVDECDDED